MCVWGAKKICLLAVLSPRACALNRGPFQKLLKPPPFILACCSSADHQPAIYGHDPCLPKINTVRLCSYLCWEMQFTQELILQSSASFARPWVNASATTAQTQSVNNGQNVTRLRWQRKRFCFYLEQEWLFYSKVMKCHTVLEWLLVCFLRKIKTVFWPNLQGWMFTILSRYLNQIVKSATNSPKLRTRRSRSKHNLNMSDDRKKQHTKIVCCFFQVPKKDLNRAKLTKALIWTSQWEALF